jgi:hypothetical protein
MNTGMQRSRWAAVGAAAAFALGAGGIGISHAINPSGAAAFVPITPCRVLDTRPAPDNIGNRDTPIGASETHTVTTNGSIGECTGIPAEATGVSLNVTAVDATAPTFLTLWPTGATRPTASNLNPTPGSPPTPNAVTTGLSAGGAFDIFNRFGTVNVIVDINGYYTGHDHDDRYYTQAEVDAAVANAKSVSAYAGGPANQEVVLTGTAAVVRSVSITAPVDGTVTANSSGYVWLASGTDMIARCSLTTGTSLENGTYQYVEIHSTGAASDVVSGTRGFDVAAGQVLTVNLVCDEAVGQAKVSDTWIAAVFTPD